MVEADHDSDCAEDKEYHVVVIRSVIGTDLLDQYDRLKDDKAGEN